MGQAVTIACSPRWEVETFAPFLETIALEENVEFAKFVGQLQITGPGPRWPLVLTEFSDQEASILECKTNDDLDERFRGEVAGLRFFSMTFHDLETTRRALRSIARAAVSRGETMWFDTDYGWVIHAADFLQRTEADPSWDWRHAPEE